jgi:hypothetical protein
MASNCYMGILTQKINTIGLCVQQSIQRVAHAPRSATAYDWSTTLISMGLAIVCAIAILSVFLAIETTKQTSRRRFT